MRPDAISFILSPMRLDRTMSPTTARQMCMRTANSVAKSSSNDNWAADRVAVGCIPAEDSKNKADPAEPGDMFGF